MIRNDDKVKRSNKVNTRSVREKRKAQVEGERMGLSDFENYVSFRMRKVVRFTRYTRVGSRWRGLMSSITDLNGGATEYDLIARDQTDIMICVAF